MSTYKELIGKPVKYLSSDPTDAGAEGQVWYNSTSGTFKTVLMSGSYAAGGTLNTGRYAVASGGTATAGLMSGGDLFPAPVRPTAATEEYNGTAWTNGGNLNTARAWVSGAGLQTAAIDVTGESSQSVELYDGSTWTNSTNLPVISDNGSTFGTQTAAIHIQGGAPGPSYPANAYEFTAGTWTSIPSLPTTNNYGAVTNGIVTAGIAIGGGATQKDTVTEYNGTAWTTTTPLPYPLYNAGGNSVGTQASTAIAGGQTPPTPTAPTNTFLFDGTSWNASGSLSTGRGSPVGSAGTQSSFYIAGGPPQITATEEFSLSIYSPIAATWASGGNMGTSRYGHAAAGDKTAALVASGRTPAATANVEEYNGTSWSEQNNVATPRFFAGNGFGTQTAAIIAGGFPGSVATESYDGTNWTTVNSMNNTKYSSANAGTSTAGLLAGGNPSVPHSEEWDGTNWTEGNNLNTTRDDMTGCGTQTAALGIGGAPPPGSPFSTAETEEYDGTSWTIGGSLILSRRRASGSGTQTDALCFGGLYSPGPTTASQVEGYDGTSWSTRPSMGTSRYNGFGFAATANATFAAGGLTAPGAPNVTNATEEFTGEIVQLGYKTLTSS